MSSLIIGVISFFTGSAITVVLMCLMYAASEADDEQERILEKMKHDSNQENADV